MLEPCKKDMMHTALRVLRIFVLFLPLVFLVHCGKGSEEAEEKQARGGQNRAPVIQDAEIIPQEPSVKMDLTVAIRSADPDGDSVAYRYQWMVNGDEVPNATDDTLSGRLFKRGDLVQCRIIPTDGRMWGGAFTTSPVEILNAVPMVDDIRYKDEVLLAGDVAEVEVEVSDPDDDSVSISYDWWVNKRSVQKNGPRFSLAECHKHDRIFVRVRASDAEGYGPWIQSKILMVQNCPPRILSVPPARWSKEKGFQYEVEAEDPDGDAFQVRVEGELPPGMSWDEEARTLTWRPGEDVVGSFAVKVIAEDDEGGVSIQELTLNLELGDKVKP